MSLKLTVSRDASVGLIVFLALYVSAAFDFGVYSAFLPPTEPVRARRTVAQSQWPHLQQAIRGASFGRRWACATGRRPRPLRHVWPRARA